MRNTSLRASPTLSLCSMAPLSTSVAPPLPRTRVGPGYSDRDALLQPPRVPGARSPAGAPRAPRAAGPVAGDRGGVGRARLARLGAARGTERYRGGADAGPPA